MQTLRDVLRMTLRAAYVLAITASLTFGFGALQTVRADHCPNDGFTWLGDCTTEAQCHQDCLDAGGIQGNCDPQTGCCLCAQ